MGAIWRRPNAKRGTVSNFVLGVTSGGAWGYLFDLKKSMRKRIYKVLWVGVYGWGLELSPNLNPRSKHTLLQI